MPDWVFQEIDKMRRGFLWSGKDKASGGQCLVAWTNVCLPTELGGLGVTDLRLAAYALRLRWVWLKRTDADRPWKNLDLDFGNDPIVQAMFQSPLPGTSTGNQDCTKQAVARSDLKTHSGREAM